MKHILFTFFLASFICISGAYATASIDTLCFRVFVAADRSSVEYFGGEQEYQKQLNQIFRMINKKWNGYVFNHFNQYYQYIPDLKLIYEGSSTLAHRQCRKIFDFQKHDLILFLDGKYDHDGEQGSFACGTDGNGVTIVSLKHDKKQPEYRNFFLNWEGITHELGHYRGVTDLYADDVRSERNPVNGRPYQSEKCIMRSSSGVDVWSSYATHVINKTAFSKQPTKDYPTLFADMFPLYFKVKITSDKEKPLKDVIIRLYGTRASYYDVATPAYRTFRTDEKGICLIEDIPKLYTNPPQPERPTDLPWGRWFGFLMEIEHNGVKQYEWLPEYKVQNVTFLGKDTYYIQKKFVLPNKRINRTVLCTDSIAK